MNILPDLPRPQYMVAPEILLSSLAAHAYGSGDRSSKEIGRTYKKNDPDLHNSTVKEYYPRDQVQLAEFDQSLRDNGFVTSKKGGIDSAYLVADAVRHSVLGTKSLRSNTQAAAPLTPSLALTQNLAGMLNKQGPADIGKILDTIFHLGAPESYTGPAAHTLLKQAYEYRLNGNQFLEVIDRSTSESLLKYELLPKPDKLIEGKREWSELFHDTPFRWFHDNWLKITSAEWCKSLPARVWVDWATTVLRLGIGMSYLWEASWIHAISGYIQRGKANENFLLEIKESMLPPLPWESEELPVSMRNVSSILKHRVKSAHALRDVFLGSRKSLSVEECQRLAQEYDSNEALQVQIMTSLKPAERTGKNTWEAISYTLAGRDSVGEFVDYYGLLRRRGSKYLLPSPGVEWMTVAASLTCDRNRRSCDAGEVLDDLQLLGARPRLQDLIGYLEAAGLARGSADADRGVRVERAF
ncbi:hypothetical protein [Glutamicibacter mishrai]|uniref:hypothetical protein n=1 Tax=Glutamicibacter mishrai TaxID=1775880 RepID=UPI0015597EA6|nr:hypothetical protein [Glutamicibacter mishrai]